MTDLFSEEQKAAARREKKKLLFIWLGVLTAFVALVLVFVILNIVQVNLYRDRSLRLAGTLVCIVASIAFGCFTLFFFSIKYRLTRKYCRMLRDMDHGLKDTVEGKFVEYDENVSMKDGVYFYAMVLDCKPLKREDITMRKVLIEHTVPKLELAPGTRLKIVSHANILVSYEILGA